VKYPGPTVGEEDISGLPETLKNAMKGGTQAWDRERIRKSLAKPLALAKKSGLLLYCGEWGCLPTMSPESRIAWYRDVLSVLEENRIGWAIWDYKGGFGLLRKSVFDWQMLDVLLSRSVKED